MLVELIVPPFLYLLLTMSFTGILEMVFPVLEEPSNAMWLLALVNLLQIPVFFQMYRRLRLAEACGEEREGRRRETAVPAWKRRLGPADLLSAVLGGFFLARGFNALLGLTPLPRLFPAYETVSETIYRGSLLSQAAASVVTAPVLEELLPYVDAMNIDLKGFTGEWYEKLGGDLETVKRFIARAAQDCHVELTTLIVPGENDSEEEMDREARWIASLDREIPLHVTRFFPRYRMADKAPTPVERVYRLRNTAAQWLRYVYVGNC